MNEELKTAVVRFVQEFYDKHQRVPSVKEILLGVKTNRIQFYHCFPGKMVEVCRCAGLPVPEERFRSVRAALKARSNQRNRVAAIDLIGDYKKQINDLEAKAQVDPSMIPTYVREVMPRLDPGIWGNDSSASVSFGVV